MRRHLPVGRKELSGQALGGCCQGDGGKVCWEPHGLAYTGDAPRGTAKVWDDDCEDIHWRLHLGHGGGHQDLLQVEATPRLGTLQHTPCPAYPSVIWGKSRKLSVTEMDPKQVTSVNLEMGEAQI